MKKILETMTMIKISTETGTYSRTIFSFILNTRMVLEVMKHMIIKIMMNMKKMKTKVMIAQRIVQLTGQCLSNL